MQRQAHCRQVRAAGRASILNPASRNAGRRNACGQPTLFFNIMHTTQMHIHLFASFHRALFPLHFHFFPYLLERDGTVEPYHFSLGMRFSPSRDRAWVFPLPPRIQGASIRCFPRGSGRSRCRRATLRWAFLPFEVPVGPGAGVKPFSQFPVPHCSPAVDPGRLLLAHTRPSDPTLPSKLSGGAPFRWIELRPVSGLPRIGG